MLRGVPGNQRRNDSGKRRFALHRSFPQFRGQQSQSRRNHMTEEVMIEQAGRSPPAEAELQR